MFAKLGSRRILRGHQSSSGSPFVIGGLESTRIHQPRLLPAVGPGAQHVGLCQGVLKSSGKPPGRVLSSSFLKSQTRATHRCAENSLDFILTETNENGLAVLTIDRPRALNACNVSMVMTIRAAIARWKHDTSVRAVMLKGNGGKAFSSGGDVKSLREALEVDASSEVPKEQVFQEYKLIFELRKLDKPTIALLEGTTMGFGLVLSCSSDFRIATERTRLAMPENNIGLFPDVGFAYLGTHLLPGLGRLLAFTGVNLLGAADAVDSRLATNYVHTEQLPAFVAALRVAQLEGDATAAIEKCVGRFASTPEPGRVAANGSLLNAMKRASSLPQAYARLEAAAKEEGSWASELLVELKKGSPFSQAVTWRLIKAAEAELNLPEPRRLALGLERDFATACRVLYRPDFRNGVRAVLVDKSGPALWMPPSPSEVSEEDVEAAIAPLPAGERILGLPLI